LLLLGRCDAFDVVLRGCGRGRRVCMDDLGVGAAAAARRGEDPCDFLVGFRPKDPGAVVPPLDHALLG